ncbi:Yip1 family protein [Halomicrobium katesii]|uniref:Yip1 family protein n=1 Tax=Halomicrobium katesii TaxID=437163 RepID=UPI00036FE629|nr:Yip1 family protein [Halomicrobium katesii]
MAPRTPLLRPDRYFADREPTFDRGLIVAALVVVGTLVMVAGLGAVFSAKIDGTVMVDNPDRPSDQFCDGRMNESFSETNATFGCDEPAEIERNIDTIIDDAMGQFYGPLLVGVPVVLFVVAGLLHLGTALAGGQGSFGNTLTVAAWGFVPALVTMPLAIAALWVTMDPMTISQGMEPATFQSTLLGQIENWTPIALAFNAVGSLWGAVIWGFGLERGRNVSLIGAAIVSGSVAFLLFVVGLA